MSVAIRSAIRQDLDAAIGVWRRANAARRAEVAVPAEAETGVRGYTEKADAFLIVADDAGEMVGMALGMQGLADDGAGAPLPGLCHVSMVFVDPSRWGVGIGKQLLSALTRDAKGRGYRRAQLWTHRDNLRAQRLYDGLGWTRSGRTKVDDCGEDIVHYEVTLCRAANDVRRLAKTRPLT